MVQDPNMGKIKLGYETLEKMKSMLDEEVDHKFNQYIRSGSCSCSTTVNRYKKRKITNIFSGYGIRIR